MILPLSFRPEAPLPEQTSTDDARVAVVTGGAGAIGGAIVRALQASGHRTVVIDRDGTISADLGSESSTREAAATVLEQFGRVDVDVVAFLASGGGAVMTGQVLCADAGLILR